MNHLHVKQLRGAETESDDQSVLSFDVSTEGDVDNLSSLSDLEDIFTPPTDSNVHHLGGKVIYLPQDSPPARQLGVVSHPSKQVAISCIIYLFIIYFVLGGVGILV
jgi:hypothetical protein